MYNRENRTLHYLMVAFFLSGASALIYQLIWMKELTLIYGSTTFALTTIIACFMAGISLGSYLMGHRAFKVNRVILLYGIIELCIAVYAIFMPFIFELTDFIYLQLAPLAGQTYLILVMLRFILSAIVLILPTTLMGATLPLIIKYYVNKDDFIVRYSAILYAVNTFGGVLGAFLCGFFLMEAFGLMTTNYIAVFLNIIVFIVALLLEKRDSLKPKLTENILDKESDYPLFNYSLRDNVILWALLFSGFTAMMCEIVWTRQLILIYGSSLYSYTCILVIFLLGISLGSAVARNHFQNNIRNIYTFAFIELSIGLLIVAGTYYYTDLFYINFVLYDSLLNSFSLFTLFITTILLILLPSILFGMLFPLALRLFTPSFYLISERTGVLYFYNTIGCVLGSLCCGFILIPLLGLKWTLIFGASINIIIAGVFLFLSVNLSQIKAIAVSITVILVLIVIYFPANWDKNIMTSGFAINQPAKMVPSKKAFNQYLKRGKVVFYKEGYHSNIAVFRSQNGIYTLYNNGKADASTDIADVRTQISMGYIPMLLAKDINNVLIIGMGSGMTAGVVEKFPVKHIDLVEIEQEVLEARKFFYYKYGDPLADERLRVTIDDARNYLKITPNKYDVIISEPSNVWVNNVANLFTQEYYKVVKKKLTSDGIFCQWIQSYNLDRIAVKSVIKALQNEFDSVYVFYPKTDRDIILIASNKTFKIDLDQVNSRLKLHNIIKKDLSATLNIRNIYEFATLCLVDAKDLKSNLANILPNTDDNMFLEFNAIEGLLLKIDKSLEFSPLYCTKTFGGINKLDVSNPQTDFYKKLAQAASDQLNRARLMTDIPIENSLIELYNDQLLSYARKYHIEFPKSTESYELLGTVYLDQGQINEGIKYLKIAADMGTVNPQTYNILSLYYNGILYPGSVQVEPETALKYAKKAHENASGDVSTYYILAVSYYSNNDYQKALKILKEYYAIVIKFNLPLEPGYYELYSKLIHNVKN